MKMKQLTFLLLSIFSTASFAGNFADKGAEANPQDNTDDGSHFYIDVGANGYYFDQPSMNLPVSTGAYTSGAPYPTTESSEYNADNWTLNPNITLGYQFLTDNPDLQKIFGQQNAIELRMSYFHNTGTDNTSYGDSYYVNPWFIDGSSDSFANGSFAMTGSSVDFDNTYEDIGLYYTGNKVINNDLVNSPYVGIDISYLKQDSNYTADMYTVSGTPVHIDPDVYLPTTGSDDLSSYSVGFAFGDKLTKLFSQNYGVYGSLGAGVYWMHTSLSASQLPRATDEYPYPPLQQEINVDTTDDQFTFKLNAEAGLNYYFKNNQDPSSARVTLLAGLDYWNDVAYAQNPTGPNEEVKIAYGNSFNPYAGLQLHIPF